MSNFITRHIVKKIGEMVKEKQSLLKVDGFIYFDEMVQEKVTAKFERKIHKINQYSPYLIDSAYPSSWYSLKGSTLLEAFDKVKNNKFYVYKKIDGKDHKARLKNR
jgi:hypothetical protein